MSSETKQLIKEVVKEELVKMQDKEISPDKTVTKTSSKRKREHLGDGDESPSDAEKKSRAKKSRHQSQSSSVLENKNGKASSDCSENEDKIDETGSERAAEEPDLDSSSLPSLEDEPVNKKEKDKKKKPEVPKTKRKKKRKDSDSSDTATDSSGTEFKPAMKLKPLMKLKRFIALCGVRRNYKQMLGNCKTIDSMIKRLKKELEDLGVEGNPTIEKCKKAREKMERARDAAELDTSNIIAGRPRRRVTLSWHEQKQPPSSTYQRTLDSESDSDQQKSNRGQRKTNWKNLQGIISDDGESD